MHTSIQMLCHMDIYNWPVMVRCYTVFSMVVKVNIIYLQ